MSASNEGQSNRLERAASAVTVFALILCLFTLYSLVVDGRVMWRRFVSHPSFYFFPTQFLVNSAVPFLLFVLSRMFRRGWYGAYLAAFVVTVTVFFDQMCPVARFVLLDGIIPLLSSPRFLVTMSSFLILSGFAIGFLISARRSFEQFPDPYAVERAKIRAGWGLRILSAGVGLVAAGMIFSRFDWLAMDILFSFHRFVSGWEPLILVAAVIFIAYGVYRFAVKLPHMDRPPRWAIVLTAVLICTKWAVTIGERLNPNYEWLFWAFTGLLVWILIELIHARRVCEDPASFGFEPVFATPALPSGSHDARST